MDVNEFHAFREDILVTQGHLLRPQESLTANRSEGVDSVSTAVSSRRQRARELKASVG